MSSKHLYIGALRVAALNAGIPSVPVAEDYNNTIIICPLVAPDQAKLVLEFKPLQHAAPIASIRTSLRQYRSLFPGTGFCGAETAASKMPVTFNTSAKTKRLHETSPIRRYLHDTGNCLHGTAWWSWVDSNFQPSGYCQEWAKQSVSRLVFSRSLCPPFWCRKQSGLFLSMKHPGKTSCGSLARRSSIPSYAAGYDVSRIRPTVK